MDALTDEQKATVVRLQNRPTIRNEYDPAGWWIRQLGHTGKRVWLLHRMPSHRTHIWEIAKDGTVLSDEWE